MIIAFWNIQKKNLSSILVDLAKNEQIEILCLAEATDQTVLDFLRIINRMLPSRNFQEVPSKRGKIRILTSYNLGLFLDCATYYESKRWTAHLITLPNKFRFNLITVHFFSKVNWSEISLALECVNLSRDIIKIENKNSCSESLLIGDFNMNPFEHGMVAANGLNAIQDLDYAAKSPMGRTIDGTKYNFFYNPMWNFFGDESVPYGTHYFRPSGHVSHEWHVYDQIILRPSLKRNYKKGDVKIVTKVGSEQLTKAYNRPDKKMYSDHLPVLINLTV